MSSLSPNFAPAEVELLALPSALVPDEPAFERIWALHPPERAEVYIRRWVEARRYHQAYGRDYPFSGSVAKDTIGWHRDTFGSLVRGTPIVTISLGAPRTFQLRAGERGPVDWSHRTGHGDVIVLSWEANKRFKHRVPHYSADVLERLEAQLAGKRASFGEGGTLVFSMLTDGFSPVNLKRPERRTRWPSRGSRRVPPVAGVLRCRAGRPGELREPDGPPRRGPGRSFLHTRRDE